LRFVTGLAMAGAYPPAMKIMATWSREGRGLAIGILIGALTVGSAVPYLIRGLTDLPWRHVLLAASLLAIAGGAVVRAFVREGPHRFPSRASTCAWRARSSAIAALAWPASAISATCGSCTPCGRGSARFLAASLEARGGGSYAGLNASAATFLVIAIGALGCWIGGWASDRWGRTR